MDRLKLVEMEQASQAPETLEEPHEPSVTRKLELWEPKAALAAIMVSEAKEKAARQELQRQVRGYQEQEVKLQEEQGSLVRQLTEAKAALATSKAALAAVLASEAKEKTARHELQSKCDGLAEKEVKLLAEREVLVKQLATSEAKCRELQELRDREQADAVKNQNKDAVTLQEAYDTIVKDYQELEQLRRERADAINYKGVCDELMEEVRLLRSQLRPASDDCPCEECAVAE